MRVWEEVTLLLLNASLNPAAASPPLNMDFALRSLTPNAVNVSMSTTVELSSVARGSLIADGGGGDMMYGRTVCCLVYSMRKGNILAVKYEIRMDKEYKSMWGESC